MLELNTSLQRQCAWCLMVVDTTGSYTLQPGRKIKTATHGICPPCREVVRAEIDRPARAAHRERIAA
ncbi:MAG TPA: hypothetical protein VGQ62_22185 [Chloroflexota bacterium]|jgi:hypothetical protein|nr:hypothetical protein [Chloroflexota bacterium]